MWRNVKQSSIISEFLMPESKQNKQHHFYINLKLKIFLESCTYVSCIFRHLQLISQCIIQATYFLIVTIWNSRIDDFSIENINGGKAIQRYSQFVRCSTFVKGIWLDYVVTASKWSFTVYCNHVINMWYRES